MASLEIVEGLPADVIAFIEEESLKAGLAPEIYLQRELREYLIKKSRDAFKVVPIRECIDGN